MTTTLFRAWKLPEHVFGPGSLAAVSDRVRSMRAERPLLVCDRGVSRLGFVERVIEVGRLPRQLTTVFDRIEPELPVPCAEEALEVARSAEHDICIGIGGGSTLDAAKVCAALARRPGGLRDYFGVGTIPGPGLPCILIPTTSGSGSEATPNSILLDEEKGEKAALVSPHLIPTLAVLDPELVVGLPPSMTAQSGIDALAHAVESYLSTKADSYSLMYSGHAIRLAWRSLARAVRDGRDLTARAEMHLASFLAGVAIGQAGTAAAHALSYPLGSRHHIHHGLSVALLLPSVLEFNLPAAEARLTEIAEIIGVSTPSSVVESLRRLYGEIGIPSGLREVGVGPDAVAGMAEEAVALRRLMDNNPREMSAEQAREVFVRAL